MKKKKYQSRLVIGNNPKAALRLLKSNQFILEHDLDCEAMTVEFCTDGGVEVDRAKL